MENKNHNIVIVEQPEALTPTLFTGLKLRKPDTKAVGIPAITSSIAHAWHWMKPKDVVKTMFKINQKGGFDCPGCAWPDPDDERSALGEYCENGMKAIAEEAQNKVIGRDFFKKNSISDLAKLSDYDIGKSGRIGEPMILVRRPPAPRGGDNFGSNSPSGGRGGNAHYEPISWNDVFKLIAEELNALASPNEAIFYTSGRTSNEAAFLYQLFIRQYGTNNMPDCSNMCHESSGKGMTDTLGIGKGSVTLDDFTYADLVIVMGQNPGTNHPRMLTALEKCKENGGQIMAINPLPEAGLLHYINPQSPSKILRGGTPLADYFLQVKINGDVALLKAIMYLLYEKEQAVPPAPRGGDNSETITPSGGRGGGVFDWDFINSKTQGIEDFLKNLQNADFQELVKESGVSEKQIREAADVIAAKKNIIVCWAMGLTQHKNAVGNIQEIVNLLLLRGSIGRKGAGTCPVRGHSNVQGDRTMGIWEEPPTWLLDNIQKVFGFDPPREHGYNTVKAIQAMHEGKGKVFFALGGNFLSATPDTNYTAEALKKCHLTVHVSTKLNRSHLVTGEIALILPCLGRTDIDRQASGEQFVSCENSMGVVSSSKGVLEPCSTDLKSEVAIVCELANAVLNSTKPSKGLKPLEGSGLPNWLKLKENYDEIRILIEKTIRGFDNFNEKVRRPEGFYLPNGAREQQFNTASGKAHFTINPISKLVVNKGEYVMMTIRSHDQFNTTIYGLNDRYRGIFNERRIILMNEKDLNMEERHPDGSGTEGVRPNDIVDLYSHYNGVERKAERFIVVPYDIPQGNVATYFPEANTLIPVDEYADKSFTPISKSVIISLKKCN
jgi:molybdopterin-dependent oxidoreductase alpha subunit